ncbi:acetyltransferase, ribosomal protein N-acetylase [Frankia torreyi]|uniref:Acetyltransferase, ribosomal protein N-acetylase n=1 Tax=Frankia torreyi TaxID=1856 RepID=A0A0D8BJH1_9ACTN|nr:MULTISPECIES: acetyltransferase [Frankia]KJE24403.1 acetyltransferase, ribosomal protein N-acetylase [Frankia torreyi]KQM02330.1 acetyltransferase, ribosomal protein N-acetylase [Frankia sp. CpI1-P]
MLRQDEFEQLIARKMGLADSAIAGGSRLHEDLGLDSFRLLELCLYVIELGVDLSEANWLEIETVGELYHRYRAGPPAADSQPLPAASAVSAVPAGIGVGAASLDGPAGLAGPGLAGPGTTGAAAAAASAAAGSLALPPPRFAGRFLRLMPVLPASTPFLYELAVTPEIGFRWRYRGSVPSYPQFEQELWQGVLTQFVIESIETARPVGHAICYNPEFTLGYAYVGAAISADYTGSGLAVEALDLFVRYVFDIWPFRKLYFEVPEFNYPQFAGADREKSAGGALELEGRLRRHDFYRGRYWDRLILAVYRDSTDGDAR